MDPARFDELVRSLAQPASRRRTVGVVVGSACALFAASTGAAKRRHRHGSAARSNDDNQGDTPKPNGQPCVKDAQCQSGVCCGASHGHHGVCAAPATIPECGGRCSTPDMPATIQRACGTMACPSCEQCQAQTGCAGSALLGANAPAGTGGYCAKQPIAGVVEACPCPTPGTFCSSASGGTLNNQCVAICAA